MATEFEVGVNAKLVTPLSIGDTVINYCGGSRTTGHTIIEDIRRGHCETGSW